MNKREESTAQFKESLRSQQVGMNAVQSHLTGLDIDANKTIAR